MDPAAFENKVQERISASQQDILGQLENLLTRKLDTFRTEMYDSQRQLSEVQITKIVEMSSHSYSFKHKGNEEQFKINSKVVTKLQEAHSSIVERQDMVSAADKIAEGMNILKHRQKLIRLADSSDTGWKIVEEYEANELAEDSDDEKRIQRAENRAQRKVKAQRQARQRRFSPYSAPRPQGPGNMVHVDTTKPTTPANNRRPGLCYACGKPGHWRVECQQQQQRNVGQGPDKIGLKLSSTVQRSTESAGVLSPRLLELSGRMSHYLLQARSGSTVSKYYSYFRKWEDFIVKENARALPAQPIHVALYVTYLLDKGSSYNVVNSSVYAIKWAHSISNLPDPTENGFVKNMVEAAKRQERSPRVKKDCVSSDLLVQLCQKYKDSNDALIIRDLAMIVVSFAGFLRFDELSRLRVRDVTFMDSYASLNIEKSKTDQYRLGSEVVISKGETVACPYRMLQRYAKFRNLSDPDDFLFKPFVRSGSACKPISKCKPLSYTRARECIVQRLKEIDGGLNLGLHSLRAGGATQAANSDVNDRCWKRHGRWKTDVAKDGYVADSLARRLQVTQKLGL